MCLDVVAVGGENSSGGKQTFQEWMGDFLLQERQVLSRTYLHYLAAERE